MHKTWAIIKREYLERVNTKGFIISTLVVPFVLIALVMAPALLLRTNLDNQRHIAIIDLTDRLAKPVTEGLQASYKTSKGEPIYNVKTLNVTRENIKMAKSELNQKIYEGVFDALLVFPADIFQTNNFELYAKNVSNIERNSTLERTVTNTVRRLRMQENGFDASLIEQINKRVQATTYKVKSQGSTKESGQLSFLISYIMVFLLYMALIFYGMFVMRGVIEDKSSRVVEMITSSVSPSQLMTGKVLGIGASGLTQFVIWILIAVFLSTFGLTAVQIFNPSIQNLPLPDISIWVYVAFVVYFLLGYFLYATLYAAVGSMVSQESDAQNLQWPVLMFIILAFLFMFAVINNPDSTLSVALSLIPFFTPILMFLRISMEAAPLWQIGLSIAIVLLTNWLFLWISGRIYRIGILMYGKRASLPEALKWIKS